MENSWFGLFDVMNRVSECKSKRLKFFAVNPDSNALTVAKKLFSDKNVQVWISMFITSNEWSYPRKLETYQNFGSCFVIFLLNSPTNLAPFEWISRQITNGFHNLFSLHLRWCQLKQCPHLLLPYFLSYIGCSAHG